MRFKRPKRLSSIEETVLKLAWQLRNQDELDELMRRTPPIARAALLTKLLPHLRFDAAGVVVMGS